MKNRSMIIFFLLGSAKVFSQSYVKGASAVSLGYGFPNMFKTLVKSSVDNYDYVSHPYGSSSFKSEAKGTGPVLLKFEHGLTPLIGIGASFGFLDTKLTETFTYQDYNYNTGNNFLYTYEDVSKHRFTSLSIGCRLNFHFLTNKRLDPYAGIAAGYTKTFYKYTFSTNNPATIKPTSSLDEIPIYFAITAGSRYYFTEFLGAYAEIGFEKWSFFQVGAVVKF
jgi:hypothetical protein